MKEVAIEKINKMGKVSLIITNIAKVLVIIGMVFTLIGAIICSVIPKDFVSINISGDAQVEVNFEAFGDLINENDLKEGLEQASKNGNISVDGKGYVISNVSKDGKKLLVDTGTKNQRILTMASIRNVCISAFIYEVFVLITLFAVGALSKAVKNCETPFEENVIQKLKTFTYTLIPWVVADSVMTTAIKLFMGQSDSISVTVNMGMLMVVLTVYGLTYIFKYGAMLQQESDETL